MDEQSQRKRAADETHKGFDIRCQNCGCDAVLVYSDIGYSQLSGQWGGVHLKCIGCHDETQLYG